MKMLIKTNGKLNNLFGIDISCGLKDPLMNPYLQLFRYFFVGGTAALTDWFFYWFFVSWFGLHYILAALISFTIATYVNYWLSVRWVFIPGIRFGRAVEISLVFLISAGGLVINQISLILLIEVLSVHFMAAKIIATGVVFFWNFFLRKHYVFKS